MELHGSDIRQWLQGESISLLYKVHTEANCRLFVFAHPAGCLHLEILEDPGRPPQLPRSWLDFVVYVDGTSSLGLHKLFRNFLSCRTPRSLSTLLKFTLELTDAIKKC
ncbi:uncharacterized protein LOC134190237 [Corticium candelabrum]|uniref:uncharacterized protein LOC134190237 n=1 Tax=Corticium candelabrum TaxID=121492 RepID=UPI002E26913A|nr:uncharacterized protein LOC134190237 [Corticium candelabrum]